MKRLTREITGSEPCGQIGSFAIAVRSAGTRRPNGLGCALLDVINATTERVFRNVGLDFSDLSTGPANKTVASVRPIVLGVSSVSQHDAKNNSGSGTMAKIHLARLSWFLSPYARLVPSIVTVQLIQ